MQDRPTYHELLEAVQHFLETDAMPVLEGPKKFHARVAANVLAIVRRELQQHVAQSHTEWRRLNDVLGTDEVLPADPGVLSQRLRERTEELCNRIRRGDADAGPWRRTVLEHVRETVVDKLRIANPKFVKGWV